MSRSGQPLAGWLWTILSAVLVLPLSAQDPREAAEKALGAGRAWHATVLLRPVVADRTRAEPATLLLAARAAAAWGGWATVHALLETSPYATSDSAGAARELLGRAALERRADRQATDHLRVAAGSHDTPRQRGVRLALLARAFDRLEQLDSAAVYYRAAARHLPEVADWLHLRAAGVLADSASRAALYLDLGLAAARARVRWTEATARERTGDPTGAATRYSALGAPLAAQRARLAGPLSGAERSRVRQELVALLTPRLEAADTRGVIALLDAHFAPLAAAEQLAVARRAAAVGDAARALRGFSAVTEEQTLTDRDRLSWGMALAQVGRHREAAARLATVRGEGLGGAAAYQRARSLLSHGGAAAALPTLREVPERWPGDSASASVALFLAGDLHADAGDFEAARVAYREAASRYPTTSHASRALLEVGTLSHALGDRAAALAAFREVAARYPEREEGSAGAYWAGRLEALGGDSAAARRRWEGLSARVPHSYYAMAAARQLGQRPWAPTETAPAGTTPPPVRRALERVALLDSLGFDTEQRFELDHLAAEADTTVESLVATAEELARAGHTARATALAQRALGRGAPRTTRLYRLLFPVPQPEVFEALTASHNLDRWFVAGLIKQESAFNPRARSAADARGLMQVMPSVGQSLARRLGWPEWDVVLLYQPEVSLTLGTLHLAEMMRRYPDPVRVLAAYNAGASRVERWNLRPGVAEDPELFLEQIPYLETRNYVRRVLRNAEFYRALYGE